jgi:hypothetical protein
MERLCGVRRPILLPAAALQCASEANCVSYSTLGEPSKLSRGNPGPTCFACEKQCVDFEFEAVAAKPKAARHRQGKRPSRSEGYEPEMRSHAECFSERAPYERVQRSLVTSTRR